MTKPETLARLAPAERARLLEELRRRRLLQQKSTTIPRRGPGPVPLSLPQLRLWFLERLDPGAWGSHVPAAWRLQGSLDTTSLAWALHQLEVRHEVLRTTFHWAGEQAIQKITPAQIGPLPQIDLSALDPERRLKEASRLTDQEALAPFDLTNGPPWRRHLLQLAENDHILLITCHHLVADGESVGVLVAELRALYRAQHEAHPTPLPSLPIQYGDYAAWQQNRWERGDFDTQLQSWTRRLAGCPTVLSLPTDRPRPAVATPRGALIPLSVPPAVWQRCEAGARREGATPFMTALALFGAFLARLTETTDLLVGSPVSNRRLAETEGLLGLFVNTLVLRLDLSGDPSLRELFRRARSTVLTAQAEGEVPFEKVVEAVKPPRDPSVAPLVQVMLAFEDKVPDVPHFADLEAHLFPQSTVVAPFDLTLSLVTVDGGLEGWWVYNRDLFDETTVQRWADTFESWLRVAAEDTESRLEQLPGLGKAIPESTLPLNGAPSPPSPMPLQPVSPEDDLVEELKAIWAEVLGHTDIGLDDNFFDIGGHSLLMVRVHSLLVERFPELLMVDLFKYPTLRRLVHCLRPEPQQEPEPPSKAQITTESSGALAVIGMAGRFPGAPTVEDFWKNLRTGTESITFFSTEELQEEGVDSALATDPRYVPANGVLEEADLFDAEHFGISPREAEAMDPQHRLLLEVAWQALEDAGCVPATTEGPIGVFAGVSEGTYRGGTDPATRAALGAFQVALANNEAFAISRLAYKLDLGGPALSVQTACSTSLVAVHYACRSLRSGECDVALAGGAGILFPQHRGYLYEDRGIASPDGHCRAFDARAAGTVGGNGVGLVVLKRLEDALAEGDTIRAVIRGSAVNNDGADKVGFTAPGIEGQARVLTAALVDAGVAPETVGLLEGHGSGTELGDPIEVAALHQGFGEGAGPRSCALGSVKTNIGHLDAAAGVAGLIKTVLAVERGVVPPSLHFEEANAAIDFTAGPFFVPTEAQPWPQDATPRRAGVSSFGMGGTNAHAVIEEAPEQASGASTRPWHLFIFSARTSEALERTTQRFAHHLTQHPDLHPADVAWTLQAGRRAFPHRRILVARDLHDLTAALTPDSHRPLSAVVDCPEHTATLLFPGLGDVRPGMFHDLFHSEAPFRQEVEHALALLPQDLAPRIRSLFTDAAPKDSHTKLDLRRLVRPTAPPSEIPWWTQTEIAQPALFLAEVALARLFQGWGVPVGALLGYSLGDYAAACCAGVLTLEEAVPLVLERARLLASLPPGAMLAVPLSEAQALELPEVKSGQVTLAAVNGPKVVVLAGGVGEVERLAQHLQEDDIPSRRLAATQAFHSPAVDAVAEPLRQLLGSVDWQPPQIPMISGVTGDWLTPKQAVDPDFWWSHTRHTVRLADGLDRLLNAAGHVLLEVGPGQALSTLARQHPTCSPEQPVVTCAAPPRDGIDSDAATLHEALGRLWLAGVDVDWRCVHGEELRRKVPLPTYPFERRRYWIDPAPVTAPSTAGRRPPADWFYASSWKPVPRPRPTAKDGQWWIVGDSESAVASCLAQVLEGRGQQVTHKSPNGPWADLAPPTGIAWFAPLDLERPAESQLIDLLDLVRTLSTSASKASIELVVVTSGAQPVSAGEALNPVHAALTGACRVIPREIPHIACRQVDLPLDAELDLVPHLADELLAGPVEPCIALRGGRRFAEGFHSVRLESPESAQLPLVERGVYLITGGFGGIGLALAEFLAREVKAQLVLVSRSVPTPEVPWRQPLEALGAEVLALAADVADRDDLEVVRHAVEQSFGQVNGILHCAGIPGGGLIQLRTPEAIAQVFAPKVGGAFLLSELFRNHRPDFFMLCSSLSSVLGGVGQVDYCAANAVLDTFAPWHTQEIGIPTLTIGWDAWKDTGMALRGVPEDEAAELLAGELRDKLTTAEGIEAFRRLLASGLPHVAVSTRDLDAARAEVRAATLEQVAAEARPAGATGRTAHPRPALPRPFTAPRDATEQRLATLWEEVLGIESVGIHDGLIELGGHSLLALQLLNRMRQELGFELPLGALFEAPTVAAMAAVLRGEQKPSETPSPLIPLTTEAPNDPTEKPNLFLVHPAGGGVSGYRDLAARLTPQWSVWGLESPGLLEGGEPPKDLESMATLYIDALRRRRSEGPYMLGAWSLGGLIAFEMAQQLHRAGHQVPLLALFDAHVPTPGDPDEALDNDPALLADLLGLPPKAASLDTVLQTARTTGRIGPDFGHDQALRLLRVFRANIAAVEAYRPKPYPGTLLLLRCHDPLPSAPDEPTLGWGDLALGGVEVHEVDGRHDTLVSEPHAEGLAKILLTAELNRPSKGGH